MYQNIAKLKVTLAFWSQAQTKNHHYGRKFTNTRGPNSDPKWSLATFTHQMIKSKS